MSATLKVSNSTLNGVLENIAVKRYKFTYAYIPPDFDRFYEDNVEYHKLGRPAALTDFLLHEICHVIVKDQKTSGRPIDSSGMDWSFSGDINEIRTIVLAHKTLKVLKNHFELKLRGPSLPMAIRAGGHYLKFPVAMELANWVYKHSKEEAHWSYVLAHIIHKEIVAPIIRDKKGLVP